MKKIKFIDIKNKLRDNSISISSNLSDDAVFNKINTLSNSTRSDLTFFSNIKYQNVLKNVQAKACLIEDKYINLLPNYCEPIIVDNPYLSLALISNLFNNETIQSNGIISEKSVVNSKTKIKTNVQINPFSIVYQNCEIFENVYIGSNTSIGPNVKINKNVIIHDNVSISNSIIMDNCEIKSGSRIGGTGFGFELQTKEKIFHSGNVLIGKNSTIGSNTTIDRAVFDSTKIGEFSNIDNLVQIAHNVVIGDFAAIAAQVGIAGSTTIGKYVKIGGQVGVAGHLIIGDNVTIAGKSGVTKNIPHNKTIAGFPAKDINVWKKELIKNSLKK